MGLKRRQRSSDSLYSEEGEFRGALNILVRQLTSNEALREDLLQEALVHLWLTQSRRPGQTRSWYLQSCRFHLHHYLASGRSIDSGKRRDGQIQLAEDSEHGDPLAEESHSEDSVLTWVSAREILSLLAPHLSPSERKVLDLLADGLGPREIGRQLKISHTLVIRHRRHIASLVTRFGISSVERETRLNFGRSVA